MRCFANFAHSKLPEAGFRRHSLTSTDSHGRDRAAAAEDADSLKRGFGLRVCYARGVFASGESRLSNSLSIR